MKNVILAICIIVFIIAVALEIWAMVSYGGKPASEIPFWVFWVIN